MIATPHVIETSDVEASPRILDEVAKLNAQFSENGVALTIVPGAELYPSRAIVHGLDKGLPITLAGTGKYVLIDLPHSILPNDFDTTLFEIQSRGVIPILAHPERCPYFQSQIEKTLEYVERGIVFQVNVASFSGRHGAVATACAKKLIELRVPHFLASDTHRPRANSLGSMAAALSFVDPTYLHMMTLESGQAVLKGERLPAIPEPVVVEPTKESWFSKALGRRAFQVKAI